jgi:hypothetical protein
VCVRSLSDIDIADWLMTFQALVAFRAGYRTKYGGNALQFSKTNSITEPNLDQSEKGKPVLGNEAPKVLLLFQQNICAKHDFQYLPSQNYDFEGECNQTEHDMRHRSEQISKPEQSQDLNQYSDNCFNLAQFF